jgi:hypothetical protein
VLALFVLGVGVFIGSALGSPSGTSLAEGPPPRVLVASGAQGGAPAGGGGAGTASTSGDTSSTTSDSGTGSSSSGGGTSGGSAPQASAADTGGGATPLDSTGDTGVAPTTDNTGTTPSTSTLPPVKHVAVITLAGRAFEELFGKAGASSYLARELPAKGELLSNYFAIAHGGLADRIAMISGQAPTPETQAGCATFADLLPGKPASDGQVTGRGCVYPSKVLTIADQLTALGLSWRSYVEDMRDASGQPASCQHPAVGAADPLGASLFATAGNPFAYFHSVLDKSDCNVGVVPLDRLADDYKSSDTAPNFALVVPNRCHDGREQPCSAGQPAGLAATDAFLRKWIPQLLSSAGFKQDGLLVITSDDAPSTGPKADSQGCCGSKPGPNITNLGGPSKPGAGGGRVGALLLSRYVTAGKTVTTQYNHYSLLRTIEDLLSLDHLGYANASDVKAFGSDVLTASASAARDAATRPRR